MPQQHGPRRIYAPTLEEMLIHAQQTAETFSPHQPGKATARIDAWGTGKNESGGMIVWATITIIISD